MCGRVRLAKPGDALARLFSLDPAPAPTAGEEGNAVLAPRWNVAPGQALLAVRASGGVPAWWAPRWGLVTPAVRRGAAAPLVNVRAESATTRPAFRRLLAFRRCAIPVDGFYEWRGTRGRGRQPFLVSLAEDAPFALAGLWNAAAEPGSRETVTILTISANPSLAPIHDRMPVIVPDEALAAWLDPACDERSVAALLVPFAAGRLAVRAVGPAVNSVRNEGPQCEAPPAADGGPPRLPFD